MEIDSDSTVDYTLLSPHVVSVLSRRDPPIQLNIPPAAAAAAVKARLEQEENAAAALSTEGGQMSVTSQPMSGMMAQQGLNNQRQIQMQQNANSMQQPSQSGHQRGQKIGGKQQKSLSAHAASAHAAAQQAAAVMGQLHQQNSAIGSNNGAAAFVAQQQRAAAVAEVAAIQQQRAAAHAHAVAVATGNGSQGSGAAAKAVAAAALASVANRSKSGGKGKGKGKISSQTGQMEMVGATGTSSSDIPQASVALHQQQISSSSQFPPNYVPDLARIEEAAARVDGRNGPPFSKTGQARQHQGANDANGIDRSNVMSNLQSGANGRSDGQNGGEMVVMNGRGNKGSEAGLNPQTSQDSAMYGAHMSNIDREDAQTRVSSSEVLELSKHTSEVFMCAWNPIYTDLIATGSGDASARIWQMGGTDARSGCGPVRLLPHGSNPDDRKNKDVTTLEWSSNGELLATGSYDGVARVWNRMGALVHTLRSHRGPIFSLKWNRRGNYLLSGSYDKSTIVWDVSGELGFVKQQFNHHLAPALDVDWKDDITFASCSTDKTVHVCRVGSNKPLQTYTGHTDEVNAVKWDPSGTLLASCSDDCTAKVWDFVSGRNEPRHDFKSHQQEIYTVKWSPTGPGSVNPKKPQILATASFDGSVRLWDVVKGTCQIVLSRHCDSVYSVSFSPSGNYLASGSLAGQMYIWRLQDGKPIKSFKGKGDIFEVAWNVEETRVAACFSSNVVSVIDFHAEDDDRR
eukprot:scaffold170191_cov54-Attheya_sp.AAC.7